MPSGASARPAPGCASAAWSTGWRILDGAGDVIRSWTIAPSVTVADTNGTPLTQVTFGKDGHLTAAPKLQVSPSTTVAGVGPRCVKVDLMGRPYAMNAACS